MWMEYRNYRKKINFLELKIILGKPFHIFNETMFMRLLNDISITVKWGFKAAEDVNVANMSQNDQIPRKVKSLVINNISSILSSFV